MLNACEPLPKHVIVLPMGYPHHRGRGFWNKKEKRGYP